MRNEVKIQIGIILVGLLIGAISYWFQPYGKETVLGFNMWLLMCIGTFLGSSLLMVFLTVIPSKIALTVTLGEILALLARIIYDTSFWDSSSHNLAPIEFIVCAIVTIPSAFAGVYLTLLIKMTIAAAKNKMDKTTPDSNRQS